MQITPASSSGAHRRTENQPDRPSRWHGIEPEHAGSDLGDRGGERGLAVADVPDGADVHVGLPATQIRPRDHSNASPDHARNEK